MGCCGSICRKIFAALLSLIKVGISIAIICIVAIHLYTVNVWVKNDKPKIQVDCLIQGSVKGGNVCEYTYAVCGLSMLLSLVTSILLCITCDLCGLGDWFQFGIQAFQTAWWIIAGIVITDKVLQSNSYEFDDGSGLPKEGWRNCLIVLAWINAGISTVLAIIYLVQACKCCGKCFSCCGGDDDRDNRV